MRTSEGLFAALTMTSPSVSCRCANVPPFRPRLLLASRPSPVGLNRRITAQQPSQIWNRGALHRSASVPVGDGDSTPEKGVSIPIGQNPRRTLQVSFKCNKCEASTARLVNPLAWEKGLVFVQCSGCGVWHKLVDNIGLIEEVVYADSEEESSGDV